MAELELADDRVLAQVRLHGIRLILGDLVAIAHLLGPSANRWTFATHYLSPVASRRSKNSAATNVAYVTSRSSLTAIFAAAPRGMLPYLELQSQQEKGLIRLVAGGQSSPGTFTTLTYSGEGSDVPIEYLRVANYLMENKRARGVNRWFFSLSAFLIPIVYAVAVIKFASPDVAAFNFSDTLLFILLGSTFFFALWMMALAIYSSNAAAGVRFKPVIHKRQLRQRLVQISESAWRAMKGANGSAVAAIFGVLSFIVALLAWLAPMK
ncbi:hypothetical protein ACFYPF_28720 [Micromonospora sp. NPDC005223]|uniref:hypothetical protein n=1 Tax=Micromonospora sp. NPDC005223 TaxID=3364227 RepID=UPI003673B76C